MDLLEYQGKQLFARHGVPVPEGAPADSVEDAVQRAREIGVRTALGAQVRDIAALVVGQSMAIAGGGLAVGLIASYWLTAALQKFLYGVTPHDPVSFAAVAALLLAVSVLASIVPARRAARVDPVHVMR